MHFHSLFLLFLFERSILYEQVDALVLHCCCASFTQSAVVVYAKLALDTHYIARLQFLFSTQVRFVRHFVHVDRCHRQFVCSLGPFASPLLIKVTTTTKIFRSGGTVRRVEFAVHFCAFSFSISTKPEWLDSLCQ